MPEATIIALGAVAIGITVTFLSVILAISARKKSAAKSAATDAPDA